jgi:beta-glucanase (GH16 family)
MNCHELTRSLNLPLYVSFSLVLCLSSCGGSSSSEKVVNTEYLSPKVVKNELPIISEHWRMVWSDEFEQPFIDQTKWSYERNCFGGGNNEKQCYTERSDNAYIENGNLVIKAIREDYSGPATHDDSPDYDTNKIKEQPYTSSRLRTLRKGDWTYGRFEIRAKLPQGQGTWPAIWMLPTEWKYGDWAGSGEIDIMEAVNLSSGANTSVNAEKRVHGTLHYGQKAPGNVYSGTFFKLPNNEAGETPSPSDDFHVYALEWERDEIRWYVDGMHYATQQSQNWFNEYTNGEGDLILGEGDAPFNQKFHLLLNFAVGGNWPENVNAKGINESVFPQTFEIDYVRVYQCAISPDTGKGCAAVGNNPMLVTKQVKPGG